MRHRQPRLPLDLLRFGRPMSPRAKWALAATVVAALAGTSATMTLAGHDSASDSPHTQGMPHQQISSTIGDRRLGPSRSSHRSAATAAPHPTTTSAPTPSEPAPSTTSPAPQKLRSTVSSPAPPSPSVSASSPSGGGGGSVVAGGDRTPPQTTAVTLTHAGGTWTLTLTSTEVGTFRCSLDGRTAQPCTAAPAFTGLSSGQHTLAVRAVDLAGNVDPTPAVVTTQVTGGGSGLL